MKLGFNRSKFDHYMHYKNTNNSITVYLLVYVDDMLVVNNSKVVVQHVKRLLNKKFEIKKTLDLLKRSLVQRFTESEAKRNCF